MNAPSAGPSSGSTACSGCGISPRTLPSRLHTPATSWTEPFGLSLVAQDDLVQIRQLGVELLVGVPAALAVLHGDRQHLPLDAASRELRVRTLDAHAHVTTNELERPVRAEHAREHPGLAEDLEAVADPEHGAAVGGERDRRRPSRARSARSRRSGGSRRTRTRRAGRRLSRRGAPRRGARPRRGRRPTRRAPSAASRSSFDPGNVRTPILGLRSLTPRSARSRSSR